MVKYFSEQRGRRGQYDLAELRKQLKGIYNYFEGKRYLAQWAGYPCVDGGDGGGGWVNGEAGDDAASYIFAHVGRDDLFPIDPVGTTGTFPNNGWSEDQIFDMFQFLGTVISKPVDGRHHDFNKCGFHPSKFERNAGLEEYRAMVNRALARYGNGWELRPDLSIAELPPDGMLTLVEANVPESIGDESRRRVVVAIEKYRRRGATKDDRRDAVRDLGDVLEKHRQQAKATMGQTETDLFNILNNFDIRHNNELQKADYDPVFMAGLFYHYLNMIHILGRLLDRQKRGNGG